MKRDMELIETILSRRSVRDYIDRPVGEKDEELLLRAAMQAPSAHNRQPWHFVVIRDRNTLRAIGEFHPYAKMLLKAPLAIAVCGDRSLEANEGYLALNCAAATQNILLAAHTLGLGAVWIAIYPRAERMSFLSEKLQLPQHILPISLVSIGHPARQVPPEDRFTVERVHRECW